MTPERYQKAGHLYHAALEIEPEARAAFLDEACGEDQELRREAESLLRAHDKVGNYFAAPALEVAAGLVAERQNLSLMGQSLSHYRVLSLIGVGGMGEVYLAEDTRLGRKVALKLLPKEFTGDSERVRRFELEARAASSLNHPNIVTIFEVGQVDGRHFIATEYIDGQTLRGRLSGGQLEVREALDVAAQIASALEAAHEAGIVHRDIKPENVMVRRDGLVKVLDFGLAKLTERRSLGAGSEAMTVVGADTTPGLVLGTVSYMSPEQARGLKVDARSDNFSLGVVIYEMVTGRCPSEGATASDVMAAILQNEPLPLARFVQNVPAELERIVAKALCKDREERYQTACELSVDLKSLKQELEVEARLNRSLQPDGDGKRITTTSGSQAAVETVYESAATTGDVATARSTSSAEYLVSEIKRHKRGAVLVAAAVVVAVAAVAYFFYPTSGREAIDSIAVLPFVNVSSDPNTEYLSDGITESIIYSLSRLSNLKVMSLSSVARHRGRDPQSAAHDLNVRAVVVGRVAQRGDSLAINAELVDAQDNHVLWTQNYNRKTSDIIAVQEEMSREISEKLRLRLSGEEKRRLTKRYTDNPEAYQLYITGQYYLKKNSAEARKKAVEYFGRAIERDPNYALPYTGLAQAYVVLAGAALPPAEAMPKAEAAAIKALEIDGELAAAHVSLGLVKVFYQWDWSGAEREFKRAIELNPDAADTHREYGLILAVSGRRNESISELERAQELDPFSVSIIYGAGVAYLFAGQTDRSIELFRTTLEMDPNYVASHYHLSQAYVRKGMYQEAIKEAQTAISLSRDNPLFCAQLGRIYALSGKRGEAEKVLGELTEMSRRRQVSPYYSAEIYAGLGEKDQAFALLEEAYKERFRYLVFLKVVSVWDSLRSDPRFTDLLRRVGLPQ